MKHKATSLSQRGFTAVEGVVIVVVVALLALGGWYVFNKTQDSNKKTDSSKQESQKNDDEDHEEISTTDWLIQTDNKYEVKIPDGWKLERNTGTGSIIEACDDTCLTFKAGTKATVTSSDAGKDGSFAFFLKPQATGETEALFFTGYDKTGTIAAKNVTGNTYYWLVDAESESGMGPVKGSKVYGYAFTKGANVIFVKYTIAPGADDIRHVVEHAIETLEVK